MKKAFIVVGPEGSGTYMLAEALVSSGCAYCDKEDLEEIESFLKQNHFDNVVLRRSLPHAGVWHDYLELTSRFVVEGYELTIWCIVRDHYATLSSVKRRKGIGYLAHEYNIAMELIGRFFTEYILYQPRLITYEGFVGYPAIRKSLFEYYGLEPPEMEFYNANEKYYD